MTVPCEKVGLDYLQTAPVRFTATETIEATSGADAFAEDY